MVFISLHLGINIHPLSKWHNREHTRIDFLLRLNYAGTCRDHAAMISNILPPFSKKAQFLAQRLGYVRFFYAAVCRDRAAIITQQKKQRYFRMNRQSLNLKQFLEELNSHPLWGNDGMQEVKNTGLSFPLYGLRWYST